MLTTIEALNAVAKYTNDCEKYNYVILSGYNITDFYSLQNRNIGRFTKALQKYLKKETDVPPRLPWIGCFNPSNPGLSFCLAIDGIQNNIINLINRSGYYRRGKNIQKLFPGNKCIYDIKEIMENPRDDLNPNGLSVDILFIFNNIYKEIKLMAKIPLSQRSKYLVNFDLTPKIYATEPEIHELITLVNSFGPQKGNEQFLDVCGKGMPVYSREKEANIIEDDFPGRIERSLSDSDLYDRTSGEESPSRTGSAGRRLRGKTIKNNKKYKKSRKKKKLKKIIKENPL